MFGFGNKKKSRFSGGYLTPNESPSVAHRKDRLQRLLFGLSMTVLVVSITELPTLGIQTGMYDISSETIASKTVHAEFAFEAVDLAATTEMQAREAARVPYTYSVDASRVETQLENLRQRFLSLQDRKEDIDKAVRAALQESDSLESDKEVVSRAVAEFARGMKENPLYEGWPDATVLAVALMPEAGSLPTREFESKVRRRDIRDEDGATRTLEYQKVAGLREPETPGLKFSNLTPLLELAYEGLEYVLRAGVIQPGNMRAAEGEVAARVQIIRSKVIGDLSRAQENLLTEIPDQAAAQTILSNYIAKNARTLERDDVDKALDWDLIQSAAFEMAKSGVTDTLFYDQVVTEANRAMASSDVKPIMKSFDVNEIIQDEGRHWTEQSRSDVETYWGLQATGRQSVRPIVSPLIANIIFVSLLLLAMMRAMPVLTRSRAESRKYVNVMLLILGTTMIVGRIACYFDDSGLLVPVTAGAILLTILTNERIAAVTSAISVILLSIQYGHSWELFLVGGAMCFTGIASLYAVRKRGDMAGAAIKATVIGLVAAVAIKLAQGALIEWQTLYFLAKIGANGAICLFIVPGLLSPLERLFGITTDIQLLEYSDLNNDLLRRLAIEVPATYAHSLMLGQLAEITADAIGANGLLARVCAYYHDIGKLRRPEYFSENQTGQNIHDDLSPRLSARAIASHVTEGAEMAREYHLPQPIINGILEHHGTLLISFFYQQALDQQKHGDVREEDFRYPGPKPQSPETAILMICDAVESGVRAIKTPNEERIREFISRMIHQRSEDRQFDECDLTLKKLDVIGEVLAKQMTTLLHTRIAYPERPAEQKAANVIHISGSRE